MRIPRIACCVVAALASTACALDVTGESDVTVEAGAGPHDASAEAFVQPLHDASSDASNDVRSDVAAFDGCVDGGSEVCTDGIDNDCDGLVDCADPGCTAVGYACTPAIPTGWSLVAFDATTRPACPTGYGTNADLYVDPSGAAASCGCSCSVQTPPSCVHGTIATATSVGPGCGSAGSSLPSNDGACTPASITIDDYTAVSALAPSGGACQQVASSSVPALAFGAGRTCSPTSAALGGGCTAGNVCAPKAPSPYAACVSMAGNVACAGGYTSKHIASPSAPTDTRGCTACGTCGAPSATCTGATLTVYGDAACMAVGPLAFPANGSCVMNAPSPRSFGSYKYSAAAQNAACAVPVQSTPTGGVSVGLPETICCTP